jgi:hypothetical protein
MLSRSIQLQSEAIVLTLGMANAVEVLDNVLEGHDVDACKAVSWWSDARRQRLADADETRCRLCVKIWRKRGLYHLLAKRSFWRCLIQNINPPLSFWKSSIQNLGFFDD